MKRLVVCCDGTWFREDDASNLSASNVTLLARAILPVVKAIDSSPSVQQIVYYQKGVGSSLDTIQHLPLGTFIEGTSNGEQVSDIDGALGIGVTDDVRAVYGFIAHNFVENDEIYLFGWSRGAFTARSVAGLISDFGILTRKGMDGIAELFTAYQDRCFDPDAEPKKKSMVTQLRQNHEHVQSPIKCVGVWDTVGSMGIPDADFFWPLSNLVTKFNIKYQFHDTDLHPNIQNAFHAVALDEDRKPLTPTLWVKPPESKTTFRQVWFPGTHSSVGGGDEYHDLSNITLIWMIQQVIGATNLQIDRTYLEGCSDTIAKCLREEPWGCASFSTAHTGVWKYGGTEKRIPGKYATDTLHESVRERLAWYKTQPQPWTPELGDNPKWEKLGDLEADFKEKYEAARNQAKN